MVVNIKGNNVNLNECYFHAFKFEENAFKDIMINGIKSKILQGCIDKYGCYNGSFYISLYKGESNSIMMKVIRKNPCIILDKKIRPIKASFRKFSIFNNTPIPIRESMYDNEYQSFLHISPKYFLGIGVNLDKSRDDFKERYMELRDIIIWLNLINKDIEIINTNTGEVIDKKLVK